MTAPILQDLKDVNETWGRHCTKLSFFVNKKLLNSSSPEWNTFSQYGDIVPLTLLHTQGM
jgi:hypothetical protein